MVASLVFFQMLSGVAPLFTLSARAEGISEPTQVVEELTPTPTPVVEPSVVPEPTVEPTVVPTVLPTEAVEPTIEPTQEVEPTVLPESGLTPTPVFSIDPFEQICVTSGPVINSTNSQWVVNSSTGIAETKSKVELGVTYVFPLDSKVTVTFNCLPKDESLRTTLKIERISVSELNLPEGVNPSSDFAYDITTGMNDGVFKYDVTLPKPVGTDAEVSYMENIGSQLVKIDDSKLDQSSESVKANDLDHFTIFIVTTDSNKPQVSTALVNNTSQVFLYPSKFLDVSLTVTTSGSGNSNDWKSTGYKIGAGGWLCANTDDHSSTGTYNESFNIQAPAGIGTYVIKLIAYNSGNCTTGASAEYTMDDAIVVVSIPTALTPPVLPNNPADDYALTSVTGVWTGITGGSGYSGVNTNEIRWGTPSGSTQSGLKFTNSGIQTFNEGNPFYLGMLTHFNWGTISGTAANGATLKITLTFSKPGGVSPQEFSYDFDIEETSNSAGSCKTYQQSSTPCDDKITFPNSYGSTSFQIGSKLYTLRIDGFVNAFPSGTAVSSFITEEQKDNSAFLIGSLSSVLVAEPQISLVQKSVNGDDADTAPGVEVTVGDIVNFTYDIQNTGNVTMTGIVVHDDKGVVVTCPKTTLLSGESMTCTGSGIAILGQYTNIAYADGYYNSIKYTSNTEPANYFGKVAEYCGDGIVNGNEQCDGTQGVPSGGEFQCTNSCVIELVNPKVDICHASDSHSNPYITNQPNKSADVSGHDGHNGPIWFYGITESWGDIIPPFSYIGGEYVGKNWTAEGQSIWNNGCSIPEGTIKVSKVVSPSDSGASSWDFSITGPSSNSVTGLVDGGSSHSFASKIGSYKVTESAHTGSVLSYYNTSYSCSDGTSVLASGNGVETSIFQLNTGKNIVCTFTNTLKTSQLNVIKHVINDNGGSKVANNFAIFINGNGVNPTSFTGVESPGTSVQLSAGSYSVLEGAHDGYSMTLSADCNGSINPGETKTCTITNDDIAPTLTLVKSVVNDNGGTAVASDWILSGTSDNYGGFGNYSPVNSEVRAGTGYTLSEFGGPSGYASEGWKCDGGSLDGNQITLGLDEDVTCTITNNDIAPKLTLVKILSIDNGGSAIASAWTLKASTDNYGYFEGVTPVSSNIRAGVEYMLSEYGGPTGYTAGDWSCSGGELEGSTVKLSLAEDVTCTITNDDEPGTLIVKKVLIKDNGGEETPDDFSFSYNQSGPISFEADGENRIAVNAGTYSVIETSATGYRTSSSGCTGIYIPNGGEATCTITNDDISPRLRIVKTVINNDGGTKRVSDFVLKIDNVDIANNTYRNVDANEIHYVSEINLPGYAASAWGRDCNPDGSITLKLGESKTCTITNNDIKPKLQVVKVVVNDNGGSKVVSDFPLYVGQSRVTSGVVNSYDAGWKRVSEIGEYGYNATFSGDCNDDGWVKLNVGDETKVCTITNDDIQPKLIVKKFVDNDYGGTLRSSDFNLHVNRTDNGELISTFPGSTSGKVLRVNAGSYKVSEDEVAGYRLSFDESCNENGIVNLKVGDVKVCELKNHDIMPKLEVIKNVINDDGGTMHDYNFWIKVHGNHAFPFIFWGDDKGTDVGMKAGNYNVEELFQTKAYAVSYSEECSGKINIGEKKTCIITNDDVAPLLYVEKTVINDDGGKLGVSDFEFYISGDHLFKDISSNVSDNTPIVLSAGGYSVGEFAVKGYEPSIWSGDCEYDGALSLELGEVKTCRITNDDIAPKLRVLNFNDVDGNGQPEFGDLDQPISGNDFELKGTDNTIVKTTDVNGNAVFTGFIPGTYELNNDLWENWRYTDIDCRYQDVSNGYAYNYQAVINPNINPESLSLEIGDDMVCTYGQQTSSLLISKFNYSSVGNRVGDLVDFEIVVSVPEQIDGYNTTTMRDVVVTDIPSLGFSYNSGDTPDYMDENNGKWNVGSIDRGDQVSLNFDMLIGTSIDPGDYKDLAWAKGRIGEFEEDQSMQPVGSAYKTLGTEDGFEDITILALDEPTQLNYFVGTSSNVIEDPTMPMQQVVLGSNTVRLPRTGLDDMTLIIMALTFSAFGGSAIILGLLWERRKKILPTLNKSAVTRVIAIIGFSFLSLFMIGTINKSYAQDLSMIKLEQPESPTRSTQIKATYVAYDISGAELDVQCMVKPVASATFTSVLVADKTASSSFCEIDYALIPTDGIYDIKVQNGAVSSTVQVEIDRTAPPAPTYLKLTPETCKNRIDFTTLVDKDIKTTIDIFRGESTTFVAGPLTILESVEVNSGASGSSAVFTSPDCSKTYYYAIQAVDSVGNRSGFVGDVGTNVTYYTVEPTTTSDGTVTNGSTTGTGADGTGTNPTVTPSGTVIDTSDTDGLVAGATDNAETRAVNTNNLLIIFIVIGAIILGGFIFEIRLKRSEV
jgi:hypothetical protein